MNCVIAWTSRDNSFSVLIHSAIKISIKSFSETGGKREDHLSEPLLRGGGGEAAAPPPPHCRGHHFSLCHELSVQSVNCIYICLCLLYTHMFLDPITKIAIANP